MADLFMRFFYCRDGNISRRIIKRMALVTCEECGAQASNEADKCPKCGFRLAHKVIKAIQEISCLIAFGAFLFLAGLMIWGIVTG